MGKCRIKPLRIYQSQTDSKFDSPQLDEITRSYWGIMFNDSLERINYKNRPKFKWAHYQ